MRFVRFGLLTLLCLTFIPPTMADEPDLGWKDTAELSLVATSGNSESSTFGFKNTLVRQWESSLLKVVAAGLSADSATFNRFAVGPDPMNFTTFEQSTTTTTAENYQLETIFQKEIHERLSWQAGAGWERNRFAGINSRYTLLGGLGNVWHDDDKMKFRTDYLLTYTDQEDIVPTPGLEDKFLGARVALDYKRNLTESTSYENIWSIDVNLDESEDWRSKMVNAVSVSISKSLALRVSVTWFYDNLPALETVTLFDMDPDLMGAMEIDTVPFELEESDFLVTTSLVVDF